MKVGSIINVAFRALRRNKLRSALTALGIIIGVGAVIAMVGIGSGAKAQVEAQIASLGQNVGLLRYSAVATGGGRSIYRAGRAQRQQGVCDRTNNRHASLRQRRSRWSNPAD